MHTVVRFGRARRQVALSAGQLGRLEQPVRLIWGRDDPFGSPDVARRVAAALPRGDLHLVAGGHAPWFHQARLVGTLVREAIGG